MTVDARYFGACGDATTDNTAALQRVRDYLAGGDCRDAIMFPSGIYAYSVSPNWAIQNAQIFTEGEVRLRYTGTGNAVIIDGGATGPGVHNFRMGRFIVEAPASALNGVFVRALHHSRLSFNVRGAGAAHAGLRAEWLVCTVFEDYACSVNEEGWYQGAKPARGISLHTRTGGEFTSYCTFETPVVEGPDFGANLEGALGNNFNGGTFEGCSKYGVYAGSASGNNKFNGTDFEANTTADVYCQGTGLELHGCDSTNIIAVGAPAKRCLISGGEHGSIDLTGSTDCAVVNAKFNRQNNGKTFINGGTRTFLSGVRNVVTGELINS